MTATETLFFLFSFDLFYIIVVNGLDKIADLGKGLQTTRDVDRIFILLLQNAIHFFIPFPALVPFALTSASQK